VRDAFPGCDVQLAPPAAGAAPDAAPPPPYRLTIPPETPRGGGDKPLAGAEPVETAARPVVVVEAYTALAAGPYPEVTLVMLAYIDI